jgi:hypothetical protein
LHCIFSCPTKAFFQSSQSVLHLGDLSTIIYCITTIQVIDRICDCGPIRLCDLVML